MKVCAARGKNDLNIKEIIADIAFGFHAKVEVSFLNVPYCHNIRKIRPFLTEHAAQLLVQALVISRLDYCNALLAGLPSNTIKPLQMIQNAAARLVFNEPKRAHVTPLFISLHWLPVAARIKFKTLMLVYNNHRLSTHLLPLTDYNLHPLQKSEIC